MRLLLIRGPDRTWLVDTGIGDKFGDKARGIYAIRNAMLPDEALSAAGFDPDEVTDVILTHLHFDHCGGTTRSDGTAVFPRARHHVQRRQLAWARDPTPKDRGSYRPTDFEPLAREDRLELVDGRSELAEGLEVLPLAGHTDGMQLVKVSDGNATLLYGADLVPTRSHLRTPYVMGYDNEPLRTIHEKRTWIGRAADEDWIVFFEHDPACDACRVRRGAKDFEPLEELTL
jgi:glyoxylase-like metal-dependent hydrolase (beta-lactamase superfamily II)